MSGGARVTAFVAIFRSEARVQAKAGSGRKRSTTARRFIVAIMVTAKAKEFADHVALLTACRACPNVFGTPAFGAVGGAKVLLAGQAPGPHEVIRRRPSAYTAGKRLFRWFHDTLGWPEEEFRTRVHISAV